MAWLSNKIKRDQLKPGDHIYTWRNAAYAHHGIYVGKGVEGVGRVIHFTTAAGRKKGTDLCDDPSVFDGRVIYTSLDTFLSRGYLYRYKYDVTKAFFIAKVRGGTCTLASSDPSEDVLHRAFHLLQKNGFGRYSLLKKNCEDFALYCKTGLLVRSSTRKSDLGCSGQVCAMLSLGFRRFENDIGVRRDVSKVPVEELLASKQKSRRRNSANKQK